MDEAEHDVVRAFLEVELWQSSRRGAQKRDLVKVKAVGRLVGGCVTGSLLQCVGAISSGRGGLCGRIGGNRDVPQLGQATAI